MSSLRDITYVCRDIGYGVESGDALGLWGETDWIGKREFVPVDGSPVLYLFPDEVVDDADVADDTTIYESSETPPNETIYASVFGYGDISYTTDAHDRRIPKVEKTTCGTCGRSWNDAIITSSTPAPSARCPFEYWHRHATDDAWPVDAEYPFEDWQYEVANRDTRLGYEDWVKQQSEAQE